MLLIFIFHHKSLHGFDEGVDLKTLGGKKEVLELVVGYGDLAGVDEVQDSGEVLERHFLEDDVRLVRILIQDILEVWRAGTEDYSVGVCAIALAGNSDVSEPILKSEML